jgi:branched-chain amino acid transport system permease protein
MYALSIKFVNTSVLAVDKTVDALLMTIVGGVGTLFGPLLGSVIIQYAHESLTELAKVHWIFERWLILFGIIYILIVMFFPKGIVGTIQEKWKARGGK